MSTKKQNKEIRINVRMSNNLRGQYREYCKKNKIDMSKHIREFIEKTVTEK